VSHDVVEVLSSHKSVVVQIGLGENVLNLVFSQVLSQFLSDLLQLQSGESSSSVNVEGLEYFLDFGSAFFVTELGGGKSQELGEIYTSRLVVIEFGEDLIYEFVLSSESKALEGSL
jgi:hypothetical protein